MSTLTVWVAALQLTAAQAEVIPPPALDAPVAAPEAVEAPAPVVPEFEGWAGEQRRFHFGVGTALHIGFMFQRGSTFLLGQSEVYAAFSIRLVRHDELRVHIGFAGGWPDLLAGETNISYRHALSPRFSIGAGVFGYWGLPSYRMGVEIPFAMRLGASRRHEISVALRAHAGVFNNSTYVWYDFSKDAFAFATDLAVAYTFFF